VPKAEQYLREVQEVLAEGDYRIGYFYYTTRGDKRAAASRLAALVNRYPLYSKADHALWMLGSIWEATERKDLAAPYYARIVREYPLSPLVPGAKERLKALKAPVPQADPKAVAWMTAEKKSPRKHDPLVLKPLALVHSSPRQELYTAAKSGTPTMTPESATDEGGDILTGGLTPPRIGGGGGAIVTTVVPGGPAETSSGAESVTPASDGSEAKPPAQQPASDPAKSPTAAGSGDPPKTEGTGEASADGGAKTDGAAVADGANSDGGGKADSQPADGDQAGSPSDKKDSKKESSSKKKKGLKKIVPW
jgi:outer membrane protein assembly factor BamD